MHTVTNIYIYIHTLILGDCLNRFEQSGQQDGSVANFHKFAEGFTSLPAVALTYMYCLSLNDAHKQILAATTGRNIPKEKEKMDSTKKRKTTE